MSADKVARRGGRANPVEKIKFLQINAQHAKQAQHEINRWIDKKQENFIILVQEPYIYKERPAIQPLTANKYYSTCANTRTAIYTSQGIKAWFIEHLSCRNATVISTKLNNRTTLIASIYMDYNENSPVIRQWLQDIIDYANNKGMAMILGMDSNCHSCLLYTSPSPRDS